MDSASMLILERLETPLFIVNREGKIAWKNAAATAKIFAHLNSEDWSAIFPSLPHDFVYRVYENLDDTGLLLVECLVDIGADKSSTPSNEQSELNDLQQLLALLDTAGDEWFLTDGHGKTLDVNAAAEQLYNIDRSEIIGKSVFELEKNQIFYPSVTAMVLRHGSSQTILQTTRNGRKLISTGTPLYDSDGNIDRVITNSKDITDFYLFQETRNERQPQVASERFHTASPVMAATIKLAETVAASEATVLLLGETGVGKNRLARYIHSHSLRSSGPFVEINCAAIPESLLESELFGYESGAFTGARRQGKKGKVELAHRGTLFLNEIAELPLHLQGKLLDVLQDRVISRVGATESMTVNFRVIAATNRDLEQLVEEGKFRRDLYYRLFVFPIKIPALRERSEDINELADNFLQWFCTRYQVGKKVFQPDAHAILQSHPWPGNIRELENLVERLAIIHTDPLITAKGVKELLPTTRPTATTHDLKTRLQEFERGIFLEAAKVCSTTYELAEHLQISQATVVRKLQQHQITLR